MGIFSLGYGFFTYFRGGGRILKLGRSDSKMHLKISSNFHFFNAFLSFHFDN